MMRTTLAALILAIAVPVPTLADSSLRPPMPDWQTAPASCAWHWREGGGLGLWAETCVFNGATWQVDWDADRAVFVTRAGDAVMGIAVQGFTLPPGSGISALTEVLVATGHLDPEAACAWQTIRLRPAPRTMAFHVLGPTDPQSLASTAEGEIPEPVCGPYGVSTHGLRFFVTDLHWPKRAIFVEEGQERPLFDPSSITPLP